MYCEKCGRLNQENANFCCKCGVSFTQENIKGNNRVKRQTWIIMAASILLSVVIGIGSIIFFASEKVEAVVDLVIAGDVHSIDEAYILMDDLSEEQKQDVIVNINEKLLEEYETCLNEDIFSEDATERIVNIEKFINSHGKIEEDNIAVKIQNALDVRSMYVEAEIYYEEGNYEQALTLCAGICPDEEDARYIDKVESLRRNIIEEYSAQIPQEVQKLFEDERYEEAWMLLKGICPYFENDTEISEEVKAELRKLFEYSVEKYIVKLLNESEYEMAKSVANESAELMNSEKTKDYKEKMEQEYWKVAYWSILQSNQVGNEFCLYEVKGQDIPALILISEEGYYFKFYDESTGIVYENEEDIEKYDKENDVFYKHDIPEDSYAYVEEWLAYRYDGKQLIHEYSLTKAQLITDGQMIDEDYKFKDATLDSEAEYDRQVEIIMNSEGLQLNPITDEAIEKALFD